jgi:16S rRNA G966 N2-methylase RsmD
MSFISKMNDNNQHYDRGDDDDDDDDIPQLSANALAALQEFYAERALLEQHCLEAEKCSSSIASSDAIMMPSEDWQLSQFWYDDTTATMLAREALATAGDHGRIACISCPTLYMRLRALKPASCTAICLEYDERFHALFGSDFVPYDYNDPLNLPSELHATFDIVVADPPFLSKECLSKTAVTVKWLTKKNILLCTGAIMADTACEVLNVQECRFQPRHANNLANEFRCYANYDTVLLDAVN